MGRMVDVKIDGNVMWDGMELDRFNEWLGSLSASRIARNTDGDELSVDSDSSDSEMTTVATLETVKEFMVSANAFLDLRHDLQRWLENKKRGGHEVQGEKKKGFL